VILYGFPDVDGKLLIIANAIARPIPSARAVFLMSFLAIFENF
jgi:hypothetical protein